ncbi:unnamed protein product [Closterium sp. NIES-53]
MDGGSRAQRGEMRGREERVERGERKEIVRGGQGKGRRGEEEEEWVWGRGKGSGEGQVLPWEGGSENLQRSSSSPARGIGNGNGSGRESGSGSVGEEERVVVVGAPKGVRVTVGAGGFSAADWLAQANQKQTPSFAGSLGSPLSPPFSPLHTHPAAAAHPLLNSNSNSAPTTSPTHPGMSPALRALITGRAGGAGGAGGGMGLVGADAFAGQRGFTSAAGGGEGERQGGEGGEGGLWGGGETGGERRGGRGGESGGEEGEGGSGGGGRGQGSRGRGMGNGARRVGNWGNSVRGRAMGGSAEGGTVLSRQGGPLGGTAAWGSGIGSEKGWVRSIGGRAGSVAAGAGGGAEGVGGMGEDMWDRLESEMSAKIEEGARGEEGKGKEEEESKVQRVTGIQVKRSSSAMPAMPSMPAVVSMSTSATFQPMTRPANPSPPATSPFNTISTSSSSNTATSNSSGTTSSSSARWTRGPISPPLEALLSSSLPPLSPSQPSPTRPLASSAPPPLLLQQPATTSDPPFSLPDNLDGPAGSVFLIDKPKTWTSFDVCGRLRHLLGIKKVGHAGTLDPMATGLLVVCVGRATKLADSYQAMAKEYTGVMKLGEATPSLDADTEVCERSEWEGVTGERLREAAEGFLGECLQVPPAFSALKVGGVRAYAMARKGQEVELKARPVTIEEFDVWQAGEGEGRVGEDGSSDSGSGNSSSSSSSSSSDGQSSSETDNPFSSSQYVHFRVVCSKGTYVRTLLADLAQTVGTVGHLVALRRERIGELNVRRAVTVDEVVQAWIEKHPGEEVRGGRGARGEGGGQGGRGGGRRGGRGGGRRGKGGREEAMEAAVRALGAQLAEMRREMEGLRASEQRVRMEVAQAREERQAGENEWRQQLAGVSAAVAERERDAGEMARAVSMLQGKVQGFLRSRASKGEVAAVRKRLGKVRKGVMGAVRREVAAAIRAEVAAAAKAPGAAAVRAEMAAARGERRGSQQQAQREEQRKEQKEKCGSECEHKGLVAQLLQEKTALLCEKAAAEAEVKELREALGAAVRRNDEMGAVLAGREWELAQVKEELGVVKGELTTVQGELSAVVAVKQAEAAEARRELDVNKKIRESTGEERKVWQAIKLAAQNNDRTLILSRFPCLSDAMLGHVSTMTHLQCIHLDESSGFSAEGIRQLYRLPCLAQLSFWGAAVTDEALQGIEALMDLDYLYLSETAVGDAGLQHLTGLVTLEQLVLTECWRVTSAGMVHLGKLTSLRFLNLSETSVKEDGLWHLSCLTELCSLDPPKGICMNQEQLRKRLGFWRQMGKSMLQAMCECENKGCVAQLVPERTESVRVKESKDAEAEVKVLKEALGAALWRNDEMGAVLAERERELAQVKEGGAE